MQGRKDGGPLLLYLVIFISFVLVGSLCSMFGSLLPIVACFKKKKGLLTF